MEHSLSNHSKREFIIGEMNQLDKLAVVIACSAIGLLAADYISATDHLFAKTAVQSGLAQAKLGQLALSRGSSEKVRGFGQRLVNDYAAIDRLKSTATKAGILLPASLSAKDQLLINRLSGLSGAAFDKAYAESMVKNRETAVMLFQNEAAAGSNPDLKSLASNILPSLQEQLLLARDAAGSVNAAAK